jgi:hypothetical protein
VTLFEHLKSILHANASTSPVYSVFVDESIDQNHGATFDSLLLSFGSSREGLSNDIFFWSYQGYKKKKYVECFIFLFGEVMFKLIKICGLCY